MAAEKQVAAEFKATMRAAYVKIIGLHAIEDYTTKKFLERNAITDEIHIFSTYNRIRSNATVLKHTYVIGKVDVISACFKVTVDRTSCVFGYTYVEWDAATKQLTDRFVCTGPTYKSQDGEYRNRLIQTIQMQALFEKYSEVFDMLEPTLLERFVSGRMTFQVDLCYPDSFPQVRRDAYERSIDSRRLPLKLFMMCWMVDFHTIHNGSAPNHINMSYRLALYKDEDVPIYTAILKKYGTTSSIANIDSLFSALRVNIIWHRPNATISYDSRSGLACGQKLFPMTVYEALRVEDINFNVWREIYVSNMCTNLVLNLISPSFPFIGNWFYVQHTHAGIYDNPAMHDKYEHSKTAATISERLRLADKFNYIGEDRDKGVIDNKFMKLSRTIQKSVVFADSNIQLTDLSLCVTSEHVGHTFRDIPMVIKVNDLIGYGITRTFAEEGVFHKYVFEFIYGFLCANTKIGVIHGDMHLNNATLYKLYEYATDRTAKSMIVKNPRICYVLEDVVYMFPHFGRFGVIIDFSRAIIGDHAKIEHEFSTSFANLYFRDQKARMGATLYHHFPKFTSKNRDAIDVLLTNNYPLMFKILSAIDAYVVCTHMGTMFSADPILAEQQIPVASGLKEFCESIAAYAKSLLTRHIRDAIARKILQQDDIEWPNFTIIRKFFGKYILPVEAMGDDSPADYTIVDIFNYNNDVTYDVDDYDTWGPILSIDIYNELCRKHGVPYGKDVEEWFAFRRREDQTDLGELLDRYKHKDSILQFEPWMLM